jgi:hypothetical protein
MWLGSVSTSSLNVGTGHEGSHLRFFGPEVISCVIVERQRSSGINSRNFAGQSMLARSTPNDQMFQHSILKLDVGMSWRDYHCGTFSFEFVFLDAHENANHVRRLLSVTHGS